MTGIFVRVQRNGRWQNLELDCLTDDELQAFLYRDRAEDRDWRNWVKVLAGWIRDNVHEAEKPE